MGSRRTLITIAAVAVGAIAVFLIYGYVSTVKDEAFADAERVKVYVVEQGVAKGTYGEEAQSGKLIVESEIPKKFLPENAIRTFDDIAGKVAVGDLAVNQIVTTDMFADPGTVQSSFADRLEKINDEDQVAITIQVDQVRGVAGLLRPGDYVNVLHLAPCLEGGPASDPAGGTAQVGAAQAADDEEAGECQIEGQRDLDPTEQIQPSSRFPARYLAQKVQILAVDQTPVALPGEAATASEEVESTDTANAGLITLIVPARTAQYIASIDPAALYLTLVARDYQPVPQTPIDAAREPLPGEDPDQLTPYGPTGPGGE